MELGDYGYRSLARLLEAVIEQQYPLWIDPNWVAFRARTAPRSVPRHQAKTGPEKRQRAALAQRPTDLPLSHDLIRTINEVALRFPIAHRAWQLLPRSFRSGVRRSLRLSW